MGCRAVIRLYWIYLSQVQIVQFYLRNDKLYYTWHEGYRLKPLRLRHARRNKLYESAGWHRSKAVVLEASSCALLPCDRTSEGCTASPCPPQVIIIKPLPKKKPRQAGTFLWCRVQDSNLRRHKPSDLQSDVFDRFTNPAIHIINGATCRIRTDDPLFTKQVL